MTIHNSPRNARGVSLVRAEGNPTDILAKLNAAFEAFKAENDTRLKAIEKGREDVVTNEKVERINSAVGDLQAALDQANQRIASLGISDDKGRKVRDAEYSAAFAAHMRKGDVQASLTKGTASEGGYTAPVEWDRTLTDKLIIESPMRRICKVQSISTGGFSKLYNNRGTASGWVGETAARPETSGPAFASLNWAFGELYANPAATQTILDDSELDLESWLAGEVQTEFAYQEGVAFVSGNGTNKPNGILTYVTGGANAATHPFGAITTVNSGAATALAADGIFNLVYALPSAFTGNARFAMNRATQGKVRLLKDGQGNYLWQPSAVAGQPASLAGFPLEEIAAMPDIAAGAKPILFGDFMQTYLIIDRIGIRVLRDPYTNKPYVMFYTTKRVGGGVANPEAMKAQNISA